MTGDRPSPTDAEIATVAQRILAYLELHPKAADTWEGIASWWLPGEPRATPEAIRTALDDLVAAGLLAARRLPSADWLYSAAQTSATQDPEPNSGQQNECDEDGNS